MHEPTSDVSSESSKSSQDLDEAFRGQVGRTDEPNPHDIDRWAHARDPEDAYASGVGFAAHGKGLHDPVSPAADEGLGKVVSGLHERKDALKQEVRYMKADLKEIKKRLREADDPPTLYIAMRKKMNYLDRDIKFLLQRKLQLLNEIDELSVDLKRALFRRQMKLEAFHNGQLREQLDQRQAVHGDVMRFRLTNELFDEVFVPEEQLRKESKSKRSALREMKDHRRQLNRPSKLNRKQLKKSLERYAELVSSTQGRKLEAMREAALRIQRAEDSQKQPQTSHRD